MKRLGLILLAIAMLTMTVACGKKKESAGGSSDGKVVIRFGWWGGDSRHKATLEAIELFKKKYPNIDVKPEYAGWTGYNEKLTTQIVGNSAPDLMQVNWNLLYDLGSDKFLDLKGTDLDLNNYPADALKLVEIDGKTVAAPLGMSGRVFYYQKNAFDKAGVAIPKSFADLKAAGKAFQEKLGKGNYPLFLEDYRAFLMVLYYLEQTTGKPFIANNKVNYTVEELQKGFDFYLDLVKSGVTPSIAESQSGGVVPYDQEPRWINGQFAGLYEWDSSAGKVSGSAQEGTEVVVGGVPTDFGKAALFNKISMTYAINAKTKYPKETALLLNFLLTDPEAVKAQKLERGIPLNKAAFSILEGEGALKGLQYEGYKTVVDNKGQGISEYFESEELRKYYRTVMQELGTVTDSKQAAEKITKMVNDFLNTK